MCLLQGSEDEAPPAKPAKKPVKIASPRPSKDAKAPRAKSSSSSKNAASPKPKSKRASSDKRPEKKERSSSSSRRHKSPPAKERSSSGSSSSARKLDKLSDEEFLAKVKCTREDFALLPVWKQKLNLSAAGLA